jgi:hypothetical protein
VSRVLLGVLHQQAQALLVFLQAGLLLLHGRDVRGQLRAQFLQMGGFVGGGGGGGCVHGGWSGEPAP